MPFLELEIWFLYKNDKLCFCEINQIGTYLLNKPMMTHQKQNILEFESQSNEKLGNFSCVLTSNIKSMRHTEK